MNPRSFESKEDEGSETPNLTLTRQLWTWNQVKLFCLRSYQKEIWLLLAEKPGAGLNKHTPLANTHPFPVGHCLGAATVTTFPLQDAPFPNSATGCCLLRVRKKISFRAVRRADS